MRKILIVRELSKHLILHVKVERSGDRANSKEVARFSKSGMGYVAMGAAGKVLIKTALFDEIRYDGSREMYDKLVKLGVIEPLEVPLA